MRNSDPTAQRLQTLQPFGEANARDIQTLAASLMTVSMSAGEEFRLHQALLNTNETLYLLPLQGLLFWQRDRYDRPPAFSVHLPVGSLWLIDKPDDPDPIVVSLTTGQLGFITYRALHRVCRQAPELWLAVAHGVSLSAQAVTDELTAYATQRLSERLARLLLVLQQEEGGLPVVRYSHSKLARLLGSNRESVTIILQEFVSHNWVRKQRACITLIDTIGLESFSNGFGG